MLRFEDIVFGPIRSRRLGSSLGINLLPAGGKLCNFDCVYCECGWNKDGRTAPVMPDLAAFEAALEAKLSQCAADGTPIDSITFSGNGEPTLNPDFPAIVDATLRLRDLYYPSAVVSVLSNATTVGSDAVFAALRKVDNPIMKIDAPRAQMVAKVNRPVGVWDREKLTRRLKQFEGNFVLQTMFLRWDASDGEEGFDTAEGLEEWMDLVRELRPREVMVYSLDRETPKKNLRKYSYEEMEAAVKPLLDEGLKVQIKA